MAANLRLNIINYDHNEVIYSVLDSGGAVLLDHERFALTTEITLADIRASCKADALAKKAQRAADATAVSTGLTAMTLP